LAAVNCTTFFYKNTQQRGPSHTNIRHFISTLNKHHLMPPRSIWAGMRAQWTLLPLHRVDLTGQTVMVTGSNVGLGLEAAKHFARMNPKRLVMAVRNRAKGEKALEGEHTNLV
jgi:hypothetical protein